MDQENKLNLVENKCRMLMVGINDLPGQSKESVSISTIKSSSFLSNLQNLQCRANIKFPKNPLAHKLQNECCADEGSQQLNFGVISKEANDFSSNLKGNKKQKKQKKSDCLEILSFRYIEFLRERESSSCSEQFREFLLRRNCQNQKFSNKKIDLGVCSLTEVLGLIKEKCLISRNLYNLFELSSIQDAEKIFIEELRNKNSSHFDSAKYVFTPVDHRMFSYTLVCLYPLEFQYPSRPVSFNNKVTAFYEYLYSLQQYEYWELYHLVNQRFQRYWIPQQKELQQFFSQCRNMEKDDFFFVDVFLFDKSQRKLRKKS